MESIYDDVMIFRVKRLFISNKDQGFVDNATK